MGIRCHFSQTRRCAKRDTKGAFEVILLHMISKALRNHEGCNELLALLQAPQSPTLQVQQIWLVMLQV